MEVLVTGPRVPLKPAWLGLGVQWLCCVGFLTQLVLVVLLCKRCCGCCLMQPKPNLQQIRWQQHLHFINEQERQRGTPLTSLILAGRIPGRVRTSESHPEEKMRRRNRSESEDEKAESEKKGLSETDEEEYMSQEKEDRDVEEIRDSESEASLLDAEMDRALKEAQPKETGTGQKEEDFSENNFSPLKALIRPAWEWWKRSPSLKPTEPPGGFGELEEVAVMGAGRKPKRRRDEPWRSTEARGAGDRRANLSGALRAARRFRERRRKKLPMRTSSKPTPRRKPRPRGGKR